MSERVNFRNIELLVLDVDGVMTDGKIILTPDGQEIKEFHVRDGAGLKYWQRVGKKVAIISGRGSPAVSRRAKELGIELVRLNIRDKLPVYEEMLGELGLSPKQSAVMADDLTDLPMLLQCGLPIAVADAVEEVRQASAYVTATPGGKGAVREAVEYILRQADLWEQVMSKYQGTPAGEANER